MTTGEPEDAWRGQSVARIMMLAAVMAMGVGPLLLLVLVSVGDGWFFPALWPPRLAAQGWAAIGGRGGTALREAVVTSTSLACETSILACIAGTVIGRAMARLRGWRRQAAAAAAFLPVAAPALALGTGLQVMLLGSGLAGTHAGVLVAHLIPATGYLALLFLGTFTVFDWRAEDEARTLGATAVQTWWRVTIPLLRPQIAEAAVIGFLISWSQFALTLIAGGGAVRTLPLEVFSYVRAGEDRAAAVGALLLTLPPAAAFAILRWGARRTTAPVS